MSNIISESTWYGLLKSLSADWDKKFPAFKRQILRELNEAAETMPELKKALESFKDKIKN